MNQIIQGDCLEVMRGLPDNSVDAIVTDPPYGLSKEPNILEVLQHWLAGEDYKHRGSGFMGKSWDSFVPGPSVWREVYRVLKPGGHVLAFAGTRTQDLMAISLRMAGFEFRDCLMWCFGSGFPKSHDVSKAIDKAAGAEREVVGIDPIRFDRLKNQLDGSASTGDQWQHGKRNVNITAPATEAAQQWQGWGSALKPAYEPILLMRKPSPLTIAETVQEWGTGAINVDGCRVEATGGLTSGGRCVGESPLPMNKVGGKAELRPRSEEHSQGRWPANLILSDDDEVRGCFPETTSGGDTHHENTGAFCFGKGINNRHSLSRGSGSAARFFKSISDTDPEDAEARRITYCGKATKSDRDEGLDGEANTHCTVKPCELMRYLCRLITPPGGTILDPYMGSGSTGKAAHLEGFQFIGIEQDPEYVEIARARIAAAVQRSERMSLEDRVAWLETQVAAQSSKLRKVEAQQRQMSIFDALGDANNAI
jgi:DNA modification methylase